MARPERQPLSPAGYFFGIVVGALLVWGLSAAWIELLPTSVLPPRYARNIAVQTMMHQCADNDVAIFGDSRARSGINPNGFSIPALNLAEGAYNPAVDFYRARNMLQCAHRPKLVILSYSLLLFRALPPFLVNDFFIDRLITDAEITEILDTVDKTHDQGILTVGHFESVPPLQSLPIKLRSMLYHTDFPLFYAPSMLISLETGVLPRWYANRQTYDTTISNRGQYPFDGSDKSDAVFQDAGVDQYPRSATMDLYFGKLVELLTGNHIPVLILTMPINRPTFNALGPARRQALQTYLESYAAGHPDVTVVEPVLAPWPSDMFADGGGHPNRRGQIEATRLINRCVEAVLAMPGPVSPPGQIDPTAHIVPPGRVDPKACSMAYNAL